jgi:hypoxanthine phosphoribosyltransferase
MSVVNSKEHHIPPFAQDKLGKLVIDENTLAQKIKDLGQEITQDYLGRKILLVGVLKGAAYFMSDISREIKLPLQMDYMAVSSYGTATKSSGVVRIVKDLDLDLSDKHVLIIEDIVDSGLTLSYLQKYLHAKHPLSVETCCLFLKTGNQKVDLDIKYIGFEIGQEFVVGYGLDYNEIYRNLNSLYQLNQDQM